MNIILKIFPLLLLSAGILNYTGCDILGVGTDHHQPAELLRNGSFETWDSVGPKYWTIEHPESTTFSASDDVPPQGGNHSLSIQQTRYNPATRMVQGIRVPVSARRVKLDLWATFGSGSAVFVVKNRFTTVASDTIFDNYLPVGWQEYTRTLDQSVQVGDSVYVELRGIQVHFDLVKLELLN